MIISNTNNLHAFIFGLVVFYGISNFVGYLKPNPVFIYVYMVCKQIVCSEDYFNQSKAQLFTHS